MQIKIRKKSSSEILLYILLIVSIYLSGPVNTSVSIVINNNVIIALYILLILLTIPFVYKIFQKGKYTKTIVYTAISLGAYWIFNYIRYNSSALNLLLHFVWFICFLCVGYYSIKLELDYRQMIFNIVCIIAIFSLAMYIIVGFNPAILPSTKIYWGDLVYTNYFNLYYEWTVTKLFGTNIRRLQGIFWEPGVYAVYLNLALYYFVFIKTDKRFSQYLLLAISILLTFSTTGIILGILFSAVYFASNPSLKRYRWLLIVILGVLSLGLSLYVWNQKKNETNYKMMSYSLRMSDLTLGIQLLLKNPIFGIGYQNDSIFTEFQGFGRGSSNGFITWCYTMGLVGLVLLVIPFLINIIRQKNKPKRFRELVFLALFVVLNSTEPLVYTPIMWLIVSIEYAHAFEGNRI